MEYWIERYVNERRHELEHAILKGKNLLVTSPTDSGKTRAIMELGRRHPDKRIAFVMPTQNLIRNLDTQYSVPCGRGSEFARDYRHEKFVCTTYDTCLLFDKPFDIIVIDEAHTLAGNGSFRTETLASLLELPAQKILLTGTPLIIENLSGYERIDFRRTKPSKDVKIFTFDNSVLRLALEIIENRDPNNLLFLRINSKDLLDELHEILKDTLNVVKIYSESDEILYYGQDEDAVDKVRSGMIPSSVSVVLSTSVMDAGVTFEVYKDVDCHAIALKDMPNPIDIIQLSARVRSSSNYKMNINIYGQFGNYGHFRDFQLYEPTTEQLVKMMSYRYNELTKIDQESYISLLAEYHLNPKVYIAPQPKTSPVYAKAFKGDVMIMKNLNSFKELFIPLKKEFREKDCQEWLEYFTGTEQITSKPNTRIKRLFEKATSTVHYRIHPSLYLDSKFYEQRLDSLIMAVDLFESSQAFKGVVMELLEGMNEESFTMSNKGYKNLGDPQQKAVRTLAELLYKGQKWDRDKHTLKRKKTTPEIELYLTKFTWRLVQVA